MDFKALFQNFCINSFLQSSAKRRISFKGEIFGLWRTFHSWDNIDPDIDKSNFAFIKLSASFMVDIYMKGGRWSGIIVVFLIFGFQCLFFFPIWYFFISFSSSFIYIQFHYKILQLCAIFADGTQLNLTRRVQLLKDPKNELAKGINWLDFIIVVQRNSMDYIWSDVEFNMSLH